MGDDVYQMIKERDMFDQCSVTCLKYELIDYMESTYGEDLDTVYLMYYGFGDLENLNCDRIALEEETATSHHIDSIHAAGKKVDVWTCNGRAALQRYMYSGADGVITDDVDKAQKLQEPQDFLWFVSETNNDETSEVPIYGYMLRVNRLLGIFH